MAKGEGRGWHKYVPSVTTIVKVFLAMVVVHLVSAYLVAPYSAKLPTAVRDAWPTV